MKAKKIKKEITDEQYYDTHGVIADITDEDIDLSLDEELRQDILKRKRKRKLRNISIKIDPLYLQFIKKVATSKGIPYQTLVRLWLTEKIGKELKIA
ncbi:MAG: CopG family antitoxin [Nitrospiraceae bacterium]|nr:BrnA antitoxin family protein [Nitrospirota bacterium]MDA8340581.1 CopG family antitoxin [Nitrospiraceae bacterium]